MTDRSDGIEQVIRSEDQLHVPSPARLREWVGIALSKTYRDLDCGEHLERSWSMGTCYAGDAIVLDMLGNATFVPYIMHSWLTYYSTTLDKNFDDQERVLRVIESKYREWPTTPGDSVDLIARIYNDLRCDGGINRFVMATKLGWLMRCHDVVIYDRLVGMAIDYLLESKFIDAWYWIPPNPGSRGNEDLVAQVIAGYRQVDAIVRTIADSASRELDVYLSSVPQLPPQLQKNRLRLLDKLLWGVGSDIDEKIKAAAKARRNEKKAAARANALGGP